MESTVNIRVKIEIYAVTDYSISCMVVCKQQKTSETKKGKNSNHVFKQKHPNEESAIVFLLMNKSNVLINSINQRK